jgi:hypothetical protein
VAGIFRKSKNPRPVSGPGPSSLGVLFHPNADKGSPPLFRERFASIKFELNGSYFCKKSTELFTAGEPDRVSCASSPQRCPELRPCAVSTRCENMKVKRQVNRSGGKPHTTRKQFVFGSHTRNSPWKRQTRLDSVSGDRLGSIPR